MNMSFPFARLARQIARLRADTSGLALIEFAYSLPVLMGLGAVGIEVSNMALARMKISQIAVTLADNMSQIGVQNSLAQTQVSETDVNDAFVSVDRQDGNMNIAQNGRIIVSSLERNASGGQWIHWQRCKGVKNYPSSYGNAGDGATGTSFLGMGPTGSRATAPAGGAVMFVEIRYDYQPLFGQGFFPAERFSYRAAFTVRDSRDLTQIYNPGGAPVSSCTAFNA